jgi:hypothetical protein
MNVCDHTLHAIDDQGQATGSWTVERSGKAERVICRVCGKFYGYIDACRQSKKQEQMRRAYLEQQRRLSCPGCGEEPFLG